MPYKKKLEFKQNETSHSSGTKGASKKHTTHINTLAAKFKKNKNFKAILTNISKDDLLEMANIYKANFELDIDIMKGTIEFTKLKGKLFLIIYLH